MITHLQRHAPPAAAVSNELLSIARAERRDAVKSAFTEGFGV
jgi:hypothetical protein